MTPEIALETYILGEREASFRRFWLNLHGTQLLHPTATGTILNPTLTNNITATVIATFTQQFLRARHGAWSESTNIC